MFAHNAKISVKALFPLPLFPIIATNPGLIFIRILLNHVSGIEAPATLVISKLSMNLSGFLLSFEVVMAPRN